jgi:hypothetical protein
MTSSAERLAQVSTPVLKQPSDSNVKQMGVCRPVTTLSVVLPSSVRVQIVHEGHSHHGDRRELRYCDMLTFDYGIKDYAAPRRRIIPHERSGMVCRHFYGI